MTYAADLATLNTARRNVHLAKCAYLAFLARCDRDNPGMFTEAQRDEMETLLHARTVAGDELERANDALERRRGAALGVTA